MCIIPDNKQYVNESVTVWDMKNNVLVNKDGHPFNKNCSKVSLHLCPVFIFLCSSEKKSDYTTKAEVFWGLKCICMNSASYLNQFS